MASDRTRTVPPRLLLLRGAMVAATLFAVTMALLPHPPQTVEVGDKYQHMTAFGTLALLAALAYPATPLVRIAERLSFLGALIEVFQSIPALHRDCDVMDWVTDTAAIAIVLTVIALVRRRGAP